VRKSREILKRLIDAILHLAILEQSFWRHVEISNSNNRGFYLETLKLIAKYDRELQEHLKYNCSFRGTLPHILNDIIAAKAAV
jgi:hypothetical protein